LTTLLSFALPVPVVLLLATVAGLSSMLLHLLSLRVQLMRLQLAIAAVKLTTQ
jgi:hypothetical protein